MSETPSHIPSAKAAELLAALARADAWEAGVRTAKAQGERISEQALAKQLHRFAGANLSASDRRVIAEARTMLAALNLTRRRCGALRGVVHGSMSVGQVMKALSTLASKLDGIVPVDVAIAALVEFLAEFDEITAAESTVRSASREVACRRQLDLMSRFVVAPGAPQVAVRAAA